MYVTEPKELPIMMATGNVAVGAESNCEESFKTAVMAVGYVTFRHDFILSTQTWVRILYVVYNGREVIGQSFEQQFTKTQ